MPNHRRKKQEQGKYAGRGRRVSDAQTLLAEAYRLDGRKDDALASVENRLSDDPKDGFANFIKGNISRDDLDFQSAAEYYLKALEKSSSTNRRDVLNQLALAFFQLKEYDRAIYYLEIELRENPDDQFARQLIDILNDEILADTDKHKVE